MNTKLGQNMPQDLVAALYKTAIPTELPENEEVMQVSQPDYGQPDETDLEFAEFLADDKPDTPDSNNDYPPRVGETDDYPEDEDFVEEYHEDNSVIPQADSPVIIFRDEPHGNAGNNEQTEITEETKDFVMLYKSRCLKCSYLIPGLLNERFFDDCHFNVGNVNCPAKNLRIIKQGINIEEQAKKIALSLVEGNLGRLNAISNRLLKLDDFLVKKVMQRAKEKCHALLSGDSI